MKFLGRFFSTFSRKLKTRGESNTNTETPAIKDEDLTLLNECLTLVQARKFKESIEQLSKITPDSPVHTDAQLLLADAYRLSAKPELATPIYEHLIASNLHSKELFLHLGECYETLNSWEEAEYCFRMASRRSTKPDEITAYLIFTLYKLGKIEELPELCKQFNDITGLKPGAHDKIGGINSKLGQGEQAIFHFVQAAQNYPKSNSALSAQAYYNAGVAAFNIHGGHAAKTYFDKAAELAPADTEIMLGQCLYLQDQNDFENAEICFNSWLKSDPDSVKAKYYLGLNYLMQGKFEQGWPLYTWRFDALPMLKRGYEFPRWSPKIKAPEKVLVYAEQGLGDEIMFASCLPDLMEEIGAHKILLECHPKLVPIYSNSFPDCLIVDRIITGKDPNFKTPQWLTNHLDISHQIAIGDLQKIYRTTSDAYPSHQGYLKSSEKKRQYWRSQLEQLGPEPKIGISWRGGVFHTRRDLRSIALNQLAPALKSVTAHFINLQYADCKTEIADCQTTLDFNLITWQKALDDYEETAALVSELDLIVSVCTSIIHLAGALGKPVLVLAPKVSEWRYQRFGTRMPWYPSATIVRQQDMGDWQTVLNSICAKIDQLLYK